MDGSLEAEFHFSMYYAGGFVSLKEGRNIPIDATPGVLDDDMMSEKKGATPRINITHLDGFPHKVGTRHRLHDNALRDDADKVRSVYELCRVMSPTCVEHTGREALMRLTVDDASLNH